MADREKVIKGLNDIIGFITERVGVPFVAGRIGIDQAVVFLQTLDDAVAMLKEQEHKDAMFRALEEDWKRLKELLKGELLKEQEAVKPYIDIDEAKCPICKVKLTRQELLGDDVLFEDFFDYCPHCGRSVKWE